MMRRRTFALSDEEQSSPLMFYSMGNRILSVFVDESGKFQFPDSVSRFYIVGLVFHDQRTPIDKFIRKLDSDWNLMGYEDQCFHAGPLIRMRTGTRHQASARHLHGTAQRQSDVRSIRSSAKIQAFPAGRPHLYAQID